jgi:ribosome-associated protein
MSGAAKQRRSRDAGLCATLGGEDADMFEPNGLVINEAVRIPLAELRFQFVRSSGPGGQHVNRSATQVELTFDLARSPSLTDEQKARARANLKSCVDQDGVLHLASQTFRSQLQNREDVTARFVELLRRALRVPKKRRPTRPTAGSKERRLESKRRQSTIKRQRQSRPDRF